MTTRRPSTTGRCRHQRGTFAALPPAAPRRESKSGSPTFETLCVNYFKSAQGTGRSPTGTFGRNITTMGARFRLIPLAVLLFALLITPNAIGQSQGNRSFFSAPVASFARLQSGWHEYRAMPGTTALSWHYRPSQYGWATSMPRDGIAVTVYFPHVRGRQRYRPLRLVLPRRPSTLLEGTHDTPEYRIFGRVRGGRCEHLRRHPPSPPLATPAPCRSARRLKRPVLVATSSGDIPEL